MTTLIQSSTAWSSNRLCHKVVVEDETTEETNAESDSNPRRSTSTHRTKGKKTTSKERRKWTTVEMPRLWKLKRNQGSQQNPWVKLLEKDLGYRKLADFKVEESDSEARKSLRRESPRTRTPKHELAVRIQVERVRVGQDANNPQVIRIKRVGKARKGKIQMQEKEVERRSEFGTELPLVTRFMKHEA